jgi:two-component system chemotaxis response regulator CheB
MDIKRKSVNKMHGIVIGSSTGGFYALKKIITSLPEGFSLPIMIAQHISPNSDNFMAKYFDGLSLVTVKEADEKEPILPGVVYIAPPNYHLLIEEDFTLTLSTEEKRNYARPSVDVLFESAAYAFGPKLIGVVLTGANNDGAKGLLAIKNFGGTTIVQNPKEAEAYVMPQAALETANPDFVLSLDEITQKLIELENLFRGESSNQ